MLVPVLVRVLKVASMEASASAEKSRRLEAEEGLARALSAKGQLERFLEGILRVSGQKSFANEGAFERGRRFHW